MKLGKRNKGVAGGGRRGEAEGFRGRGSGTGQKGRDEHGIRRTQHLYDDMFSIRSMQARSRSQVSTVSSDRCRLIAVSSQGYAASRDSTASEEPSVIAIVDTCDAFIPETGLLLTQRM
jgi:hypothetical protein